jgi:hypothetical protein
MRQISFKTTRLGFGYYVCVNEKIMSFLSEKVERLSELITFSSETLTDVEDRVQEILLSLCQSSSIFEKVNAFELSEYNEETNMTVKDSEGRERQLTVYSVIFYHID